MALVKADSRALAEIVVMEYMITETRRYSNTVPLKLMRPVE